MIYKPERKVNFSMLKVFYHYRFLYPPIFPEVVQNIMNQYSVNFSYKDLYSSSSNDDIMPYIQNS